MLFHFFIYLLHLWWQSSVVEGRSEPNLESMETSVEQPSRWLSRDFTGLSVSINRYFSRIDRVFTMWKRWTTLCKNPWWVYRLLIIFSASGFPVIIKFQPATCTLQNIPAGHLQVRLTGLFKKHVDKKEFTLVPVASLYHPVDKQCGFWPHQQIEQESPLRLHRNICSCKRGSLMDSDSVTSSQSEMLSVKSKAVVINYYPEEY